MIKVLIVYATDYQNTLKMAEAAAAGVNSVPDCQALLKPAEQAAADDLAACDALILGTPVHMGSPDWRVKKFIDGVCSQAWMKDAGVGKVGGVFATGSGYGGTGGGAEVTMLAMLNNLAELGMILIPLPKSTPGYAGAGLQWGPCARTASSSFEQTGVSEDALMVAKNHGANIARVAAALSGAKIFTAGPLTIPEK
ncbi:MAG: NAD(P)H-dependent oxidoreductase [Kiritimatiellae bacterium]|jgi:NAD(P)H dehydrogenase (quinone)|nr:NAD(P)H-dependent oxidoreductase [Kiritimatiellia bacterium]